MASPFSVFRKNQKIGWRDLSIMAMIAFVFLTTHDDEFCQRDGWRDEPVVRTTKFGNLAPGQLQVLRCQSDGVLRVPSVLARSLSNKQPAAKASQVLQVIGPASDEDGRLQVAVRPRGGSDGHYGGRQDP